MNFLKKELFADIYLELLKEVRNWILAVSGGAGNITRSFGFGKRNLYPLGEQPENIVNIYGTTKNSKYQLCLLDNLKYDL